VALSLSDVLDDPAGAAAAVRCSTSLYGVDDCRGRRGVGGTSVVEVDLWPLPALRRAGYPMTYARISVLADGDVWTFPRHAAGLRFLHRELMPPGLLCLQWRDDDPALQWMWDDGFEDLVGRVHRHLCWEEYWRRTGKWPVEDAPHGTVVPARPVTAATEEARLRWQRAS
jgi:hypothetical protein